MQMKHSYTQRKNEEESKKELKAVVVHNSNLRTLGEGAGESQIWGQSGL